MNTPLILAGTAQTEPRPLPLSAGPLVARLEGGQLRAIRWKGVEVLRGLSFLVRTPGWGTPEPEIAGLSIHERAGAFSVRYRAVYADSADGLIAEIAFDGDARGTLLARARLVASRPFLANRAGFVVLHPLVGMAGARVTVEHASGGSRVLSLPLAISPGQPVMDLRALTHSPRPGLAVTTRFEGDVFEMEDHRNWSDASFKTYSRPIGLPYPYVIAPEQPQEQSVRVSLAEAFEGPAAGDPVPVPPAEGQSLPVFALPLDRLADADEALSHAERLAELAPARLLLRYDLAHGDRPDRLDALATLLDRLGATLELVLVIDGDDVARARAELCTLARALIAAGIAVSHVAAFAKIDERSFQPGEARPPHLSEAALAALAVEVFPASLRVGGTPAFFTELNRKRPDPALFDAIGFATTPVVHAADDASVMETLDSLPHILHSARMLAGGRPLAIGPVGIGARLNPYGPAPADNPPDARIGMAARDPRQRGLFAAAWHVGYLVRIAPFGIERLAFGAPTGPFGLLSTPQAYPRPLWDTLPEGAAYPLFFVARWMARLAGARLRAAETTGGVARLTAARDGRVFLLAANLTAAPAEIAVGHGSRGLVLDAESALALARRPDRAERLAPLPARLALGPYAVLFAEGDDA